MRGMPACRRSRPLGQRRPQGAAGTAATATATVAAEAEKGGPMPEIAAPTALNLEEGVDVIATVKGWLKERSDSPI